MSNRLEKLWREVVPGRSPCPRASKVRVLGRIAAAQPRRRSLRLRRAVRWTAAVAAVLVLLTATAAAGGMLPEYSVFSGIFRSSEPSEYALSLVDMEPKSVSGSGYTMTVTSSVADDSVALFTLEIRPETEEARAFLASEEFDALTASESVRGKANDFGPIALTASWIGWETLGMGRGSYDPETDSVQVSVSMNMGPGLWRKVSVHLNTMDDDTWLSFGVNRVPSVTVKFADVEDVPGVYKVRLSPLSVWMEFVAEEPREEEKTGESQHTAGSGRPIPEVSALWEDGTLTNLWELDTGGSSGSGRGVSGELWHWKYHWRFSGVQDFGKVTALVYNGTVYPLNGAESYPLEAD